MKLSVTLRRTSVLMLLFPLMLLTGCVTQRKPLVEYTIVKQPYLRLPQELINPISLPEIPSNLSFGNSVELNAELIGLVGQCNIDRAGIKQIEASYP